MALPVPQLLPSTAEKGSIEQGRVCFPELQNKQVLVTGGTGAIGGRLVKGFSDKALILTSRPRSVVRLHNW
jgi:FlaA1/EpsC-like NDP-sugar epimerase